MNVELKRIAEKKIEQLGGDVCGVLVRKDGKLAAVDEHGRVQWLQSGHGAEPVAWWDGDTVDEETAFQFERDAIYKIPVYTHTNQPDSEQGGEWRSPSDLRSDIDVRVKLKDGSVIENCLSQSDGDFYWKGSGTEMFILEHEVVGWMPQPPKSKEGES